MNMFKPSEATTPEEYFKTLTEPRKGEVKKLFEFIKNTLPKLDIKMFGGIIGFGSYNYKSKSGREGEWMLIGLASQKNYISIYVCAVDNNEYIAEKAKNKFPKASIGKSCIRIKKLEDIDLNELKELLLHAEQLGGMNIA